MSDPRRDCPTCQQRIHPLDLSDLYRGRKVNCAHCGRGLSVRPVWWAAAPVSLLAYWALFSLADAIGGPFWLGPLLGGLSAVPVTALIRYGLVIEDAPWVRLAVNDKAWPR